MYTGNYDLVLLTEKNILDAFYCQKPPGVRHCVLPDSSHRERESSIRSVSGYEEAAGVMDRQIHALPRAEHYDL